MDFPVLTKDRYEVTLFGNGTCDLLLYNDKGEGIKGPAHYYGDSWRMGGINAPRVQELWFRRSNALRARAFDLQNQVHDLTVAIAQIHHEVSQLEARNENR